MFRRIALILNWSALAILIVGIGGLFRMNANLVGPESLMPLLPYGTALATYHFRPKLPMVWVSLALNVLLCVIGVLAVVAAILDSGARPLLAGVLGLFVFVIPCGFNVRNMLRIRRALKQDMASNATQATCKASRA
jgi:hypothetical protein